MSEALTVVRVSRDNIPIPVGCQPRQIKAARLLLERDPDSLESLADLLRQAGYSEATAIAATRRTLQSVGVTRALEALKASKPDSARLRDRAAKLIDDRLPEMGEQALVVLWDKASTQAASSPPDDTDKARLPRSWYRMQLRRWLLSLYRRGVRDGSKRCSCEHNPPRCLPRLAQLTDV